MRVFIAAILCSTYFTRLQKIRQIISENQENCGLDEHAESNKIYIPANADHFVYGFQVSAGTSNLHSGFVFPLSDS